MTTRYEDMSTEQQSMCSEAMSLFAEWLNLWHVEMKEDSRVTRENFFEYNDPPQLTVDVLTEGWNSRLCVFVLNPYHDEGGPTYMTCYFVDISMDESGQWKLTHMTQEFDTMLQTIYDTTTDQRFEANPFKHIPEEVTP